MGIRGGSSRRTRDSQVHNVSGRADRAIYAERTAQLAPRLPRVHAPSAGAGGCRPQSGGIRPQSGGIRPQSGGIRPESDRIRPEPDGIRPEPDGIRPEPDGIQPESDGNRERKRGQTSLCRRDHQGLQGHASKPGRAAAGTGARAHAHGLAGWGGLGPGQQCRNGKEQGVI